ncbi:hypothetical protein M5D96_002498 [Drosophila gunungcola]|uniref:alkaline phosphatase n=1 Tax=Drosophila gunungcola TaxID=103775 RepID=A0A9Q0BW10_9MUSC|nr:hypothetical protein M5D96_002498 [Drosophila gunungcola]
MVTTQRTKELCQTVRLKSTQVFIVAGTCLVTLLVTLVCIGLMTRYEVQNEVANVADVDYWKDKVAPSQKIWYDRGIEELNEALRSPSGPIYPKNPDCGHLANATDNVLSVLRQAQLVGLRTGFVTTQRITGATAAALGNTNSNYECDERMPLGSSKSGCLDIARQLISGQTGRSLNVIIGGGRQMLNSVVPKTRSDPVDELLCESSDGRNLLKEWRSHKLRQSKISPIKFELVQRTDELESLNASNFDFLLGVMANGDLSGNAKAPSLKLMVERSLQVLKKQDQGYLLIVEQFIQSGMDKRKQLLLLNETLVDLHTDQDTLTLVLMTNAIYPKPILDVSEETETISHLSDSFNEPEFQIQQRLHQMPSESLLFARGPKSSIFHGVRKESFLAHAVSHVLSRSIAIP